MCHGSAPPTIPHECSAFPPPSLFALIFLIFVVRLRIETLFTVNVGVCLYGAHSLLTSTSMLLGLFLSSSFSSSSFRDSGFD